MSGLECECFDGGSTFHPSHGAWKYELEPNPDCPVHFPKERPFERLLSDDVVPGDLG